MTRSPPAEFFALSSLLTGFTKETLEFAQQAADFYGEFENTYGAATTAALLKLYTTRIVAGDTPTEIADHFLGDQADQTLSGAARALIVFWYLGQIGTPEHPDALRIPSANLYVQGLAWRAVQAHPTGSSILQFGYWAAPPPPTFRLSLGFSNDQFSKLRCYHCRRRYFRRDHGERVGGKRQAGVDTGIRPTRSG